MYFLKQSIEWIYCDFHKLNQLVQMETKLHYDTVQTNTSTF